jgi:hypothetical protein
MNHCKRKSGEGARYVRQEKVPDEGTALIVFFRLHEDMSEQNALFE